MTEHERRCLFLSVSYLSNRPMLDVTPEWWDSLTSEERDDFLDAAKRLPRNVRRQISRDAKRLWRGK